MSISEKGNQSAQKVDLKTSHFATTQDHFKKNGWGYSLKYKRDNGAAIGAIRINGHAALIQVFRFDKAGTLNTVEVEKRLLDTKPTSAKEGIELLEQQSGGKIGSTRGKEPAYKVILTREQNGKFVVDERSMTSDQNKKWKSEYNRTIFRTPPPSF